MAEMKQMSLRESARFDYNGGTRHPATKWLKICVERHRSGMSRASRIARGEGKRGGKK